MKQLYNGLLKKNNGYKSLHSSSVKQIKKKTLLETIKEWFKIKILKIF